MVHKTGAPQNAKGRSRASYLSGISVVMLPYGSSSPACAALHCFAGWAVHCNATNGALNARTVAAALPGWAVYRTAMQLTELVKVANIVQLPYIVPKQQQPSGVLQCN